MAEGQLEVKKILIYSVQLDKRYNRKEMRNKNKIKIDNVNY